MRIWVMEKDMAAMRKWEADIIHIVFREFHKQMEENSMFSVTLRSLKVSTFNHDSFHFSMDVLFWKKYI